MDYSWEYDPGGGEGVQTTSHTGSIETIHEPPNYPLTEEQVG